MGLLDKAKAQATAATEMAKDAVQKGQAKLDEVQAKKTADGLLARSGSCVLRHQDGAGHAEHGRRHREPGGGPPVPRVRARRPDLGARVGCGRTDGHRHRPADRHAGNGTWRIEPATAAPLTAQTI